MADYAWRPLGELLVERGLIDAYDLEALLFEQRLTGSLLGELLVSKRIVSPIEMATVIAEQHGVHLDPEHRPSPPAPPVARNRHGGRKWRPLGRILVEKELLTESGLQRVLLIQRHKGGLLGQHLIERGYVSPAELTSALAEQHGLDVHPEALEEASAKPLEAESDASFEVRKTELEDEQPLYVAPSFLDATDFAFELLEAEDPDSLEIVRVTPEGREQVWSYSREASDAFRETAEEEARRFRPLPYASEG